MALNKHVLTEDVETVFIKLTLRKHKWLFCGSYHSQAFINYNFLCRKFCARKTALSAHPCTWEITHVKKQMSTFPIIT